MKLKLGLACSTLAVTAALAGTVPAVAAAPPAHATNAASVQGPDEAISISTDVVPRFGEVDVQWTAVGTADTTGPTQITLDLPSWMTFGSLMLTDEQTYTFSYTISPDGHELTALYDGTQKPGQTEILQARVSSALTVPPGVITATVSNPGDRNPANNVTTAGIGGETAPPPVIPSQPTVTGSDISTGPGAGGSVVTLSGTSLANGMVLFGGTPATNVTCTDTSCTATAPGGLGPVPVEVVTPGGSAYSPSAFLYTGPPPPAPPAPSLSFLAVASGPAAGGNAIYLGGANLAGGQVLLGNRPAADSSCGPSLCSATVPAGTGTVDVRVVTAGGITPVVTADRYTYTG
ncbi:IPT/TIG domain-containing protein [Kitasatospora viridis]|uniref:IPT/TIG domain-containing protein n=1 Tax=Kitasatospora viridis TaxID=281105 RepID=A0A561T6X5_9ACTN|nr:IPT/TIG domain-containing protein [Kitasatospora viridis]TWF82865.1 IPT/TIG domain-containing protein [Kitasatospora viridis]